MLRFGVTLSPHVPWPELVARAQRVEELGFDSLWLPDHIVSWTHPTSPRFDAWTALAALATQTGRLRLGTLVTHVTYRNPVAIARAALTVDHISGGRLELGIGAGGAPTDYVTAGVEPWPAGERVGRLRETIEIIERLLSGAPVSYGGRYYQVGESTFQPVPLQPRLPLTLAALSLGTLRIAARKADRWSSWAGHLEDLLAGKVLSPEEGIALTRERNRLLDEEAARAGREPRAIIRSLLCGWPRLAPGNPWSSPGAFEEFIGRYQEAGIDEFVFVYPPQDVFPEDEVYPEIVERAAGEIIPRLRKASDVADRS